MTEIWMDIKGYEGRYQVSNLGRVKSIARIVVRTDGAHTPIKETVRSQHENHKGYFKLNLRGTLGDAFVHRLVAMAFIPNPENKEFVNHINGDKKDNRVENLEWVSAKENSEHAVSTGLMKHKGAGNPMSKLTEEKVIKIKRLFFMGSKTKDLAALFNVSFGAIHLIVNNKRWRHVAI